MTVINYYYKALICYNGSQFLGWQIQENQGLTIQGEMIKALAVVSKTQDVEVIGSSRTDAGVHALGQVTKLTTPLLIPEDSLMRALNVHLPPEIRVLKIEKTVENFQPSFDAKSKTYSYFFYFNDYAYPFGKDLITHYSFDLNMELINKAAKLFVGEHDFKHFMTVGTPVKSTVREIFDAEIIQHHAPSSFFGNIETYYEFRVHGNGFLKQMVRQIMGCIWTVGRGKMSLEELNSHIKGKAWDKRPAVAPPQGLYLKEIFY